LCFNEHHKINDEMRDAYDLNVMKNIGS
jgi:hypothetical protein